MPQTRTAWFHVASRNADQALSFARSTGYGRPRVERVQRDTAIGGWNFYVRDLDPEAAPDCNYWSTSWDVCPRCRVVHHVHPMEGHTTSE